jgi:putative membrane protein
LAVLSAVLVWSGIHPRDTFTWFLEVLPALLGVGILAATYSRFRFSMLVYVLVSLHAVILMIGGHYTYAEMPAFNWLRDTFALSRNYYDRVGHFAQGFVPAIIAREFLLRLSPLRRGKLLFFIVVSICLAASAAYKFIEWWVAVAVGSAADAFLGTQGDVWDTQWDMFMAFGGAVIALLFLGGIHDRFLRGMTVPSNQ